MPEDFRLTTLENGIRVVTEQLAHVRTATVGIWVNAGTRHEAAEQNGVAHMLEHMAFKGTRRRNARQIAEQIEDVGGHLNAYTSREQTAYYARVLADDVPLASDILADIIKDSVFDEEELARERGVVLQEIGQVQDTPDDLIFDLFQECAYPNQALGRSVLGPPEIVSQMSRDTLIQFMGGHYAPKGFVVSGAGDIEHDRLVDITAAAFGGLKSDTDDETSPGRYQGGHRLIKRDLDQVHVIIGVEALSIHDDDFYGLQILSTMLGGGMSSRLFQEIREQRGLAYSIFSFASCFEDTGYLGIYAGTSPADLPELMPVTCDAILDLKSTLSEAELSRARNQLKASMMMSLENCSAVCEDIARQQLVFGRRIEVDETLAKIDAVDHGDIARIIERLFANSKPTVVSIGPSTNGIDFRAIQNRLTL